MTSPESSEFGHRSLFQGAIAETVAASQPWWPAKPTAPAGAPSIVVMIVDDMGFSDIGAFGSEIPTPHLDALAQGGMRLTNFHSSPACSPTRAALLTGCNSHAMGFGFPSNIDPGFPSYAGELPHDQPTVAENLRAEGYNTLMVGKWHLCKESDLSAAGDKHSWPTQRGFDDFYGFLEAQTNFHQPHRLYRGNHAIDRDVYPDDYYLTDDLTDQAVAMIHASHAADAAKPFFLYFAHGAVHAPLHAKPDRIASFHGSYAQGWDRIREARFARQRADGLLPSGVELGPMVDESDQAIPRWDELSQTEQELAARYMEVYAAMITSIDDSVGRVREAIERTGDWQNTIFVFMSDNGAATGGGIVGSRNLLGSLDRTDQRSTAERLAADHQRLDDIGSIHSWPAYGAGWASTSNTPFHKHKFTAWRGGHQVPFIVHWPTGLAEHAGTVRHQYAHVTDVYPTLFDYLGFDIQRERHGLPARPLDGKSLKPFLEQAAEPSPHTEQYFEIMGERAFYRDGWEVVADRKPLTPFSTDTWRLFDTLGDPAQTRDRAAEHPELVESLVAGWHEAAQQNSVFPMSEGSPLIWAQRPEAEQRYSLPITLYPESPELERFRSSMLIDGRSFRIVVDWTFKPGDTGVLFSHGGQEGGYLCYVENDQLHFVENVFGEREHRLEPIEVPDASKAVVFTVDAPGNGAWDVSVTLDGTQVARDAGFTKLHWWIPWTGVSIGMDRGSPVSADLRQRHGTFAFSGELKSVTYHPGPVSPDSMAANVDRFREIGQHLQ